MKTLNCVCLPDKNAGQIINKITRDISKQCESKKALRFPPHFTIRSDFKIDNEKIDGLKAELSSFCSRIKPIELHLRKYGFMPWKIIYLDIEVSLDLQQLHNGCMEIIEKYRTPWIMEAYKDKERFKNIKGKQREYMFKYGYYFCFEYFSPHFTVAGNDMEDKIFQDIKKKLEKERLDIKVRIDTITFMDREKGNKIFLAVDLGGE